MYFQVILSTLTLSNTPPPPTTGVAGDHTPSVLVAYTLRAEKNEAKTQTQTQTQTLNEICMLGI